MTEAHITVYGEPKPQGSKTAYVRGGRAVLVESNKALPGWRVKVETALAEYKRENSLEQFPGAVGIELVFWLTRPKTNKRQAMTTKPDLDKLARHILDCLTRQGYLVDDSYVTRLVVEKEYATDTYPPGVYVYVTDL